MSDLGTVGVACQLFWSDVAVVFCVRATGTSDCALACSLLASVVSVCGRNPVFLAVLPTHEGSTDRDVTLN